MLRLTASLIALSIAHVGSASFCSPENQDYLGGLCLPDCRLPLTNSSKFWRVTLLVSSFVDNVSISLSNPKVNILLNFTVTVDGKYCGQVQEYIPDKNSTVKCKGGAVKGSVIELKVENPSPMSFINCDFNVCGYAGQPQKIELLGQRATQPSTFDESSVASMGIDGYSSTCAVPNLFLSLDPWWTVDMGASISVHYIKLSHQFIDIPWTVSIAVTVDGKSCGLMSDIGYFSFTLMCNPPVTGQVLKIQKLVEKKRGPRTLVEKSKLSLVPYYYKDNHWLTVCEVEVWGIQQTTQQVKGMMTPQINLFGLRATQSSNWGEDYIASMGIDGNPYTCTRTYDWVLNDPWWTVDMGTKATIYSVKITNGNYLQGYLQNVEITVDSQPCGPVYEKADSYFLWVMCEKPVTGRVLKIHILDSKSPGILLSLCEVEVWGYLLGEHFIEDPVPKINLIGLRSNQSSTYEDYYEDYKSYKAIDGDIRTCTWTIPHNTDQPWWNVTMAHEVTILSVKITNHRGYMSYLGNVVITVDDEQCGPKYVFGDVTYLWITCPEPVTGNVLTIQLKDAPVDGILTICEVEVWGYEH